MIIDIGGGTTDIAVISLDGMVVRNSMKIAGDNFDEAIIRHIRKKHKLMIGERTAENMKITIGTAFKRDSDATMDVRGRDLITGLPKNLTITSVEIAEALDETVTAIVECAHSVLEKTPPELAADIMEKGIMMTGGGSLLHGLDERISQATKIPVNIAEEPVECVAIGTGKALDYLDDLDSTNYGS